jgi:hypothetical protein
VLQQGYAWPPRCFVPELHRLGSNCQDTPSSARIVVGYNAASGDHYSIGLGSHDSAYLIEQFVQGRGRKLVEGKGDVAQLSVGREYDLKLDLEGQRGSLIVDDIKVVEATLPTPLQGAQVGFFAWGMEPVHFRDFDFLASTPQIFVVMQFGEPYDSLFKEVIVPVAKDAGFIAFRANDVFRPGIVLQDIRRGIIESDIIIAEITPANPNVFYELGYAHAMEKPTILLANRNLEKLPFDISGYRVIFYNDSISGKRGVEETLRKHPHGILKGEHAA